MSSAAEEAHPEFVPAELSLKVFRKTDAAAVAAVIRKGLSYRHADVARRRLGLTVAEFSKLLGVTPRTLARAETSKLSPAASDRVARIVRVFDRASAVMGSGDLAVRWLHQPNTALAGAPPLQWLGTDPETDEVLNVLGRIEYGVFS